MKKLLLLPAFAVSGHLFSQATISELPVVCDPLLTNYEFIHAPNAQTVWAAGAIYDILGNQSATQSASYSGDGGQTWSELVLPTPTTAWRFSSLEAYDSKTAFVTMFDGTAKGKVFKTTDAGATWADKTGAGMFSGSASFANWTHFFDDKEGISMGDPTGPTGTATNGYFEIWHTIDGGDNWARTPKASLPAPVSTTEYGVIDLYTALGDRVWFATSTGRCIYSYDRGATWQATQTDFTAHFKINFRDGDHGNARLWSNTIAATPIIVTNDGGATWSSPEDAVIFNGTDYIPVAVFDADYVPGTDYLVGVGCLADTPGAFVSMLSVDDGLTWQQIDKEVYRYTVSMVNNFTGYFGAQSTTTGIATMYKSEGLILPNNEPTIEPFVINAFPNPADDILNITSNLSQSTDLWVTLTNSTGQIARRELWSNTTGPFNGTISVAGIPSGVYTVHLSNGTSSIFEKIVIVH